MEAVSTADLLRTLMKERGWRPVDLADRLEEVRPGTRSEHWKISVYRWLKGGRMNGESAEALGEALGVSHEHFVPANISQAELNELLAELASLRRLATEASSQNDELRAQLVRLERAGRRPQELLKPNAQRKATGS